MKNRLLLYVFLFLLACSGGCGLSDIKVGGQNQDPAYQKIACVGSSITQGFTLPDAQNYPTQLQSLIGPPHKVLNYGVGGSTVLKKGDTPVWQGNKYGYAIDWKPTVVVIELGTNDSKPQNWQYKSEFKNDYTDLIKSFRQLSSSPKVYICIPPPVFKEGYDINANVLHNEVIPQIYAIAEENKVPIIDLYKLMA